MNKPQPDGGTEKEKLMSRRFVREAMVAIVVAVICGAGSSYMTMIVALGQFEARIDELGRNIERLNRKFDNETIHLRGEIRDLDIRQRTLIESFAEHRGARVD